MNAYHVCREAVVAAYRQQLLRHRFDRFSTTDSNIYFVFAARDIFVRAERINGATNHSRTYITTPYILYKRPQRKQCLCIFFVLSKKNAGAVKQFLLFFF